MQKPQKPASPPVPGGPARRVCIITFGCQMNEADSRDIAAAFGRRGYTLTDDLKKADAVVVNTCTVRQRAEDKAISQIGRLRKWKLAKPEGKLFIVGCAAQKLGGKAIKSRFPFVDEVSGAKAIEYFEDALAAQLGPAPEIGYPDSTLFRSPQSAYVTIMRGCSLKCSYCIVPAVRGPAVFLPAAAILKDAAAKIKAGAKEIVLLGQTVNAWRGGKATFSELLKKVLALPGLERLRFMSPHPLYFDDAFTALLAAEPKLSRYLHLPVQSGSDRILKAMRRGYTRGQYLALLERLRAAVPGLAVSTDFIVGYPGETEADFEETLSLLREGRFSMAFCFKYSPRSDNPAMVSHLDEPAMEARLERLLSAVKKNSRVILNERIGKIEEVLFETDTYGRTSGNFGCRVKTGGAPGRMAQVFIEGAERNTLNGKVL
ncbi:MAG: tRNA (N6-isopentenyl adenosine(37)-C2)-methylthiotransferase MiaB [Elusimicrobia bacterium GWA2_61_42]|nr:MAG: tRNA (N6-isopentenyl adenosine(37)-C2)-methylthiotransferase MiaB [Elusimicrobia bacterium GWA2_61_42]OGR74580.1 MAG: tRNA (N6-isopentenyl adenosine(37)-C2)-methylthiotransferase MiaB [Elusimicrobia bacterium GWC2_61_25]